MSDTFTLRGPVKKDRPELVKRTVERKSLAGVVLGTVELEPAFFGVTPNMAVLHQVIKAQLAAKRSGHAVHQDPQRSARWWQEALQPKGHGRRSSGNHSCSALPGRWHRARPQAAQVRPKDAQEDDSPGPLLGAVGPRVDVTRGGG